LETFDGLDRVDPALEVIRRLATLEADAGDATAARDWCERALDRIRSAGATVPERREAVEGVLRRLEEGDRDRG